MFIDKNELDLVFLDHYIWLVAHGLIEPLVKENDNQKARQEVKEQNESNKE